MLTSIGAYPSPLSLLILQDAHEFLNFLLNVLVDILEKESKAAKSSAEASSASEKVPNGPCRPQVNGVHKEPLVTWVHKNFQVIKSPNLMMSVWSGIGDS